MKTTLDTVYNFLCVHLEAIEFDLHVEQLEGQLIDHIYLICTPIMMPETKNVTNSLHPALNHRN